MDIRRVFIGAFLFLLAIPIAGQILYRGGDLAAQENRRLAAFPSLPGTLEAVQAWPGAVDDWIMDRFGFRDILVRASRSLEVRGRFTPGVGDRVIIGKDDWLFLNGADILQDAMGRPPALVRQEAAAIVDALERSVAMVEERTGANVLAVIVPNKLTVYPEQAPNYIPYDFGVTRLSRLEQALEATDAPIISIREQMIAAKPEGELYYRVDTHWNHLGAFKGYQAIMEAWRERAPQVPVTPADMVSFETYTHTGGDLKNMLGDNAQYSQDAPRRVFTPQVKISREEVPALDGFPRDTVILTSENDNAPSLLIIGDSFSEVMLAYFAASFSRVVYVHHQDGNYDPRNLDLYDSDYVLIEMVERLMFNGWATPEG